MWTLYIIECQDNKLYTGITSNLDRRLREHQKAGSHFTSYNTFRELLYTEEFNNRPDAEKRENQIKGWTKEKKMALV